MSAADESSKFNKNYSAFQECANNTMSSAYTNTFNRDGTVALTDLQFTSHRFESWLGIAV